MRVKIMLASATFALAVAGCGGGDDVDLTDPASVANAWASGIAEGDGGMACEHMSDRAVFSMARVVSRPDFPDSADYKPEDEKCPGLAEQYAEKLGEADLGRLGEAEFALAEAGENQPSGLNVYPDGTPGSKPALRLEQMNDEYELAIVPDPERDF